MTFGAGLSVNPAGYPSVVGDAMFLSNHPGWSWRDLMDAPDDLVRAIKAIDSGRASSAPATGDG